MTEIFLVALSRPDGAAGLLKAACEAARNLDSVRIEALAVRMPAEAMIIPGDEAISAAHLSALQDAENDRIARLRTVFQAWEQSARSPAVSTSWIESDGPPSAEVAARAQNADLVVIERPSRPVDLAQRQTTDAAIFMSHRPVLVVPAGAGERLLGRRIAIAWKDDGRAIQAAMPALRYFADAAAIEVLVGYRGAPPSDALPTPLAERGVTATIRPIPIGAEAFGQSLLDAARTAGADLLVMGAYVLSPLREMLLGGVTRHVLAHADIPVLMRH